MVAVRGFRLVQIESILQERELTIVNFNSQTQLRSPTTEQA
jgi:hypothetical protein